MLFRILKGLGLAVLLTVLTSLVLPFLPVLKDQFGKGPYRAYLADNGVTLDLAASEGGFQFSDAFYDHQLIILAEIHGFADVQTLDLALLKHLHRINGTRVYLAEINPAQAMAFNDFVLEGDDRLAREVFDAWSVRSAQWANREFFSKLQAIARFNATMPDDEKIVFIGVDKTWNDDFLNRMIERPARALSPGFGSLEAIRAVNTWLLRQALARDEDTSRYDHILPNIEAILMLPAAKETSFYGLWGLYHGSKVAVNETRPLAMRLNEQGGVWAGEVATVASLCIVGCYNMMPAQGLPAPFQGENGEAYSVIPMTFNNPFLTRVRGIGEAVDVLGDEDALLVELSRPDTPYNRGTRLTKQSGLLASIQKFEYGGPAAEANDAVILHQGSEALTPWKGKAFDVSRQDRNEG